MISWHIEKRKISDLKPHSKNPRKLSKHDAEHLRKSLEKFGLIDKPIINLDGTLIGGHQRIKILKKMGFEEVEVFAPDHALDQKDIDELNIRLNRNTGEWDFDILGTSWDKESLEDWGFKPSELNCFFKEEVHAEDEEDLFDSPQEEAITQLGDRIVLGEHVLVCGDSTSEESVNLCLQKAQPILMVTDPPYGVNYDASWRDGIKGKFAKADRATGKVLNDDIVDWKAAFDFFHGAISYIWHAGRFASIVQTSIEESGFSIISQIIWVKQHFCLSRGDYHWKHEPCWYAVRNGCQHNWQGARNQSTVWEIDNLNSFGKSMNEGDERTDHSTQKPIECMLRPIKNNSAKGESVYDPFLGSGSTLVACELSSRKCFGIELNPSYCDIVVKRWIRIRKRGKREFVVLKNGIPTEEYNGVA